MQSWESHPISVPLPSTRHLCISHHISLHLANLRAGLLLSVFVGYFFFFLLQFVSCSCFENVSFALTCFLFMLHPVCNAFPPEECISEGTHYCVTAKPLFILFAYHPAMNVHLHCIPPATSTHLENILFVVQ